ncbi:MAG: type I 3-dehydroquinate dehydratase [Candidatus Dadabacteria bacterium]|nr:MAG: type I 3-dehydroquinate dehydratase [Candidatus Dadabacteria bacterium]
MGEHGKITRVFGTLWGNFLIYAPVNQAFATAKGQLNMDQLKTIFSILK